jgi:hypothetical protein
MNEIDKWGYHGQQTIGKAISMKAEYNENRELKAALKKELRKAPSVLARKAGGFYTIRRLILLY